MNWKRFLWASLVVFVVTESLDYLIDTVILMPDYKKLNGLLRPDVMSTVGPMFVLALLVAFVFTYIFVKGREGKGIQEGVRFGIIIWLLVTVQSGFGAWMLFPIPMALIAKWILYGLLTTVIGGILAAAIYKPAGPAKS
jgi:MFS superfamily sulfate permease-like transporter